MRKILLLFVAFMAFCLVASVGCGGSSSSSEPDPAPDDWTEMSGKWTPVKGSLIYYNRQGVEIEVCSLDMEKTEDIVTVNISGASSTYDVVFSDGNVAFYHVSGSNNHATFERNYSDYSRTNYKPSGGRLSRSDKDDEGTLVKTIRYTNYRHVTTIITRKTGNKVEHRATLFFERVE